MSTSPDSPNSIKLALISLAVTLAALAILAHPAFVPFPASAGGTVGAGTAISCDEAALDLALTGGGLVTFNCGPGPATITITSQKIIASNTIVDGGGKVTLSGGGATRVFTVATGSLLQLQNITVTNGFVPGALPFSQGGAINSNGSLVLSGTAILSSTASQGGGVYSSGPLTVTNSLFASNVSTITGESGGGLYAYTGTVSISQSAFVLNRAAGYGGAVQLRTNASVARSTFLSNTSMATTGGGAAIDVDLGIIPGPNLTVTASSFIGNRGDGVGAGDAGGIYFFSVGSLYVADSVFANNVVPNPRSAGGIFVKETAGSVLVARSIFTGNAAGPFGAGGIRLFGGVLTGTIDSVTIAANSTVSGGSGGLSLQAFAPMSVTLLNSTLTGNTDGDGGGGAVVASITDPAGSLTITIVNSTIVSNTATNGFGISVTNGSAVTVANSIVAYNAGANCSASGALGFLGGNLQDGDSTCSKVPRANPQLGLLGNDDSVLPTLPLLPGSPAIGAGAAAFCPPVDERGVPRPTGAACDLGAYQSIAPRYAIPLISLRVSP